MQKLTALCMKQISLRDSTTTETKDKHTEWEDGFTAVYNVNSPTTDTYIIENEMTLQKCHNAQANPLLCASQRVTRRRTKRPFPLFFLNNLI